MVRSSGFGSVPTDKRSFKARFHYGSVILTCRSVQVAGSFFNRHAVRRSVVLLLLVSLWFHVLFHSPPGVLFTFPSRYWFTIGHPGIFSLTRWSLRIHTEFHVLHATRESKTFVLKKRLNSKDFIERVGIQDFHFLWYRLPPIFSQTQQ